MCCLVLLAALPAMAGSAPDGQMLYREGCATCHGIDGRGGGPGASGLAVPPPNLRDGRLDRYSTSEIVRRVLDNRQLTFDEAVLRARAAEVGPLVDYLQRMPDVDWRAADEGAAVYAERCEPCHGIYGRPSSSLPPGVRTPRDLSDPAFQRATSNAQLVVDVRHGRAGMPALTPRLSEAQARQVAAFVRLLSPGYVTYSEYCVACHGAHGVGSGSFGESYSAPTVIFDRAYFAHHDPDYVRSKAWHMLDAHQLSMPHFRGVLSEAQAWAIIEYLKRPATQ
jgi:mono/diheme cytochrome c family protein